MLLICTVGFAQGQPESAQGTSILINENNKEESLISPEESNNPLLRNDFLNSPLEMNIENPVYRKGKPLKMDEQQEFLDPGAYYLSKLNNKKEGEEGKNTKYLKEQYLGDIRYNGKHVQIIVRDHESPDGDYIRIFLNDTQIIPSILLQERFKKVEIDMVEGFNKIDFVALNQGTSGPNTAEVRIFSEEGDLIASNRWNLATGGRATYIVVKEE